MKNIPVSNGAFIAMVDDEDYEKLITFKWYRKISRSGTIYAQAYRWDSEDKRLITLPMHRMVLGLTLRAEEGDHKDGNGLNNTRANLRVTTRGGNRRAKNKKHRSGRTSMYRGVSWNSADSVWRAAISLTREGNHKQHYLGRFSDEHAAARAYNKKAIELGYYPEALNVVPV